MTWFRRSMVVGALAASLLLTGCAPPSTGARASGSLALSRDEALLYAVDTDNGLLAVIDTAANVKVAEVRVGAQPARVLVGADDTIFVTNRGERSVSVIARGAWSEARRLPVGVEPSGMALTDDGRTLLVVSATSLTDVSQGTLTAIDTDTLERRWELAVGEEPRAVAVVAGDRAVVSLFKQGELVEVDLGRGAVLTRKTDIYSAANAQALTDGSGSGGRGAPSTFRSRAAADLIASPDGERVYAPVVWAREGAIGRRPTSAGGYYSGGGPCNVGAVATAGIVTVDTAGTPQPQVDDLTACVTSGTNAENKDFPASALASGRSGSEGAIQGPTVGVVDPTGEWLLVVSRESRNLAVLPATKRVGTDIDFGRTGSSVRSLVGVGHGADGLAVSGDFKRAWVYNQFDHRLDVFVGEGQGADARVVQKGSLTVAGDTLPADLVEGRKLFFDAMDPRMSSPTTNVACSTCHLEGREDGHVWQFPDGARQTPALAGRRLLSTAPYHWSGEFGSLDQFNVHTITERMGGSGLSAGLAERLNRFIDQLPLGDNPLRGALAGDALARGKAAYEKAACAGCHGGELLTNNAAADVGTLRLSGTNPDNGAVTARGFNVPSLLGVGRTAPYLHDGSQATLEDRVYGNPGDRHGVTSTLSAEEKAALVAYLKSL